jgi:hypothetical protein
VDVCAGCNGPLIRPPPVGRPSGTEAKKRQAAAPHLLEPSVVAAAASPVVWSGRQVSTVVQIPLRVYVGVVEVGVQVGTTGSARARAQPAALGSAMGERARPCRLRRLENRRGSNYLVLLENSHIEFYLIGKVALA